LSLASLDFFLGFGVLTFILYMSREALRGTE
jgi:hypothetical protein